MPIKTFKAAVLPSTSDSVELWEYELPRPSYGCVNISVLRAGVCGTDVHLWKRHYKIDEPFVFGHEGVGQILELGEGVKTDHSNASVQMGDLVYWTPGNVCHSCYQCTVERDLTGCTNLAVYAPAKAKQNTASYTQIATMQPNTSFYRIDPKVPLDAYIALGCALPTVLQGIENIGPIQRHSAVLVQGCGAPVPLALLPL
jgi:D-arabinose 1-dehydrogenase-like Zn-dependent alcohol dehydrogenase